MAMNPLHQFEIHPIGTLNLAENAVAFTNQSLWMMIATAALLLVFSLGARQKAMVPGRLQSFVELTFEFVQNLIKGTAGNAGMAFFPLILSVFLFIAVLNLFGMIPGSYTSTSQIFITAAMAFSVFIMVILVGLWKHGLHFFGLFCPSGTPVFLMPLIIPLELISFFARPLTLAVRLCANMVAGHILLKVVATFVIMLGTVFTVSLVLPFVVLVALTAMEVFVALLQAYIFTVLTCVYLNDALNLH